MCVMFKVPELIPKMFLISIAAFMFMSHYEAVAYGGATRAIELQLF
jgi:hypothetical protein